jgi:Zinc binding domain
MQSERLAHMPLDSGARSKGDTGEVADCCCTGADQPDQSAECRICRTAGKLVESITVKALLTDAALARYEPAAYRFCPDARCTVVYFSESGPTFTTGDVRARAWQKEPAGHRTICYCFGENEADIAGEIERTGQSAAVRRVRAHISAKRCACEVRNPRGTCCLSDLLAAVERLQPGRVSHS